MKMKVYRTRKTRVAWVHEESRVMVRPASVPRASESEPDRHAVLIEFEMASAGGGVSRVTVSIPPQAFHLVLEAMTALDPKATREAVDWAESQIYDDDEDGAA